MPMRRDSSSRRGVPRKRYRHAHGGRPQAPIPTLARRLTLVASRLNPSMTDFMSGMSNEWVIEPRNQRGQPPTGLYRASPNSRRPQSNLEGEKR
jgi:hypothetical protein